MRTSQAGIDLIKRFESLHDGDLSVIGLQPKMCPAGIWTAGYGRALIDPKTGQFLKGANNRKRAFELFTVKDEAEAERMLQEDLRTFERRVLSRLKVPVNQNQFDALVSHTYNTGGTKELFKLVNERASRDAIWNWFTTKYITANGVQLRGLVNRRRAEAELFFR